MAQEQDSKPSANPVEIIPPAVRLPVRRENARGLVLLSLVSFALTVILTRLFLHLAGYPMIANDVLHIAHVLWGGLLLFIASLLPLVFSNRWALTWCAILGGAGMGLFIDEVGKFITMSNDYHFPYAAPIIYATFLLTVQLYLRVRRPYAASPRAEMYRALEQITEVLDSDLDEPEREAIEHRLAHIVRTSDDQNLRDLAVALYNFVEAESVLVVPRRLTRWQRITQPVVNGFFRTATQPRTKWFITAALGVLGVLLVREFGLLASALSDPLKVLDDLLGPTMTRGQLNSVSEAILYLIRVALQGITGVLLIGSAGLIASRRERTGVRVATSTLIVSLSIVNLLVWYFDQFSATALTLSEFFILLAVSFYRSAYLKDAPLASPDPIAAPRQSETPEEAQKTGPGS